MANLFQTLKTNTSPFLLIAWPLGVLLAVVAITLMIEDYLTSLAGYLALPTKKVNDGYVVYAVAFLPQACQIVLAFIWAKDTRKGWAMLLASVFFLADLATDAFYKMGGDWSLAPLAIVESFFIFTLGSEVLFTIAVGFVAETFGPFMAQLGTTIRTVVDGIGVMLETLGVSGSEDVREVRR